MINLSAKELITQMFSVEPITIQFEESIGMTLRGWEKYPSSTTLSNKQLCEKGKNGNKRNATNKAVFEPFT